MNRREAEELLPWYVAGALSREERDGIEALIAAGEIPPQVLEQLELIRESVAEVGGEEPHYDSAILDRVMAGLSSQPQLAPEEPIIVRAAAPKRGGGFVSDLLERLQWSLMPPVARIAIAAQLLLVLGLATVIVTREAAAPQRADYQVAAGVATGDFTVAFAPTATEAEIRALLTYNRATIIAGPSALGIYTIAVAAEADPAEVRSRFGASDLVRLVQRVPQP